MGIHILKFLEMMNLAQKLFKIQTISNLRAFSTVSSSQNYHPSQVKTFNDQLIEVDENDTAKGPLNKKLGHMNSYILKDGKPHRAFSVFVFNQNGELLLQQRSNIKITFPLYWTNTCCSHPLYIPQHLEESEAKGTKLSAYDRTKFELNLDIGDPKELHLLGKILYRSQSCAEWGEYELDYVFFAQRHFKETTVNFNPEEIKATAWVSIDNIHKFLEEKRRLVLSLTEITLIG
eukprot:TRINITY_DN8635_c0_g1_i4.p1 TRINITY_DN8635_c0_g1~~TRINITY_DN8635_c0_g1_i4.p1  ORF type:complete len:245 (-),score=56.23 TRINITY_DN8635_c0_g1_i4:506-1204(-)